MMLNQIKNFENLNIISNNVYSFEKQKEMTILPLQLTDMKKDKQVNLLYAQNNNAEDVWIKNLFRLVSSQLNKKECKKYFCDRYIYICIYMYIYIYIYIYIKLKIS